MNTDCSATFSAIEPQLLAAELMWATAVARNAVTHGDVSAPHEMCPRQPCKHSLPAPRLPLKGRAAPVLS